MATHNHAVGVECANCGKTKGHHVTMGERESLRCGDCGRLASAAEDYCVQHDVDENRLPSGYDSCPMCKEVERVEAERRHQMTRDPTMEPY